MACTLTTGRKLPCKSAFGGIKKVLFADFGTIGSITVDPTTKEVTAAEVVIGEAPPREPIVAATEPEYSEADKPPSIAAYF